MKRIIAAGLASLLLIVMITASASNPGSSADSLITLSYLEGAYMASMKGGITQSVGGAADNAIAKLDSIYRSQAGYIFAPSFTDISLAAGEGLRLSMGASFILLSGSASLVVTGGTAVNISTGETVASGTPLAVRERYFCTEDTTMIITAGTALTGRVDGYYLLGGMESGMTHSVFYDVLKNNWFYEAVDFVYTNGLFEGTSANTFSPSMDMNRAMFVTVLYRLEGNETASLAGGRYAGFSDVPVSAYYNDAVIWASGNNIVTGFEDGTFRPNVSISREQMATLMYRYSEFKGYDVTAPANAYAGFPDANDVSAYASDAMRWAVSNDIIRGSDGRLLPKDTATRAQVAQIFLNFDAI